MVLLLSLENAYLEASVFQERKEVFSFRTFADKTKSEEEYEQILASFLTYCHLASKDFDGALLASVVPSLTLAIQNAVSWLIGKECLVLSRSLKTGLILKMDNPSEVGSDLLAAGLGAVNDYDTDCLVISLSTVLSFTVVTQKREFLGGSLFPGLLASADEMVKDNAQLLDFELVRPQRRIAKSTKESLTSGILYGYQSLIASYSQAMEKEYGKPLKKILTGKDSPYLKDLLGLDITYNPQLVFEGLYDIYLKNEGSL